MSRVEVPGDPVGAFVGEPSLLAEGETGGPLAGVRVAVKDAFDVAGTVTGAGNPTFGAGRAPASAHAAAVQRLVDAGASVVGKAVMDELAYSLAGSNVHFGAPVNTAAPGHLAGGSSSGSAAAVAAKLVELGLGTDTGGSIRVPASNCGLYGWRPTHGAVDITGVVPLAPSFDTVALLAADPTVLRAAAEALLEPATPVDPANSRQHRVVGWGEAFDAVRADVRAAVGVAVPGLDEVTTGLDLLAAAEAFRVLQAREAWAAHGDWIRSAHPAFAPDVAARFEAASQVTDDQVAAARAVQAEVVAALDSALGDGTVLVLPAAGGPAPAVGASSEELQAFRLATMALTSPIGLAGLPVVVTPGPMVGGVPIGVALVGRRGSDRDLLARASAAGTVLVQI